jgi:hypothetical protein
MQRFSTFLSSAQQPRGSVVVELNTRTYETVLSGKVDEYKAFLGLQIGLGWVDAKHLTVRVSKSELDTNLQVNSTCDDQGACELDLAACTYMNAHKNIQRRMQEKLLAFLGPIKAYQVTVAFCVKSLSEFASPSSIYPCRGVPIEYVTDSAFMNTWAYRRSGKDGPNCFHCALAVADNSWLVPRFISPETFKNELSTSFLEVSEPKFSDLAVFYNGSSIEHAASFVGKDQDGESIVFTKNGRADGYYLFMDVRELMSHSFAYTGTSVKYFSSIKKDWGHPT